MVHIQDIVRKHDLLRKETLTIEEKKELADIENHIVAINKELMDLQSKGFKLVNGSKFAVVKEVVIPNKEKLTISERKEKAIEIITSERAKNKTDKDIIRTICTLLGVSNTYAYEAIKKFETEE